MPSLNQSRPRFVKYDGWTVFVYVHDRFHKEALRSFKRKIRKVHPDYNPGKSTWATREALKQRQAFLVAEVKWYKQMGLIPPGRAKCESTGGQSHGGLLFSG